jgi:hypothetical protein
MWMNINQTYATPHNTNAWAALPNQGWRKVKETSSDGVTNTFLLLALARATNRQAHVTTDSANQITVVYL